MSKLIGSVLFLVLFTGNSLAQTQKSNPFRNFEETKIQTEGVKTVYFNRNLPDSGIINVTYGEHLKFICDVNKTEKELIRWSLRSKVLSLSSSREFIFNASMDFHGQYISCQVMKTSKSVEQTYAIIIVIGAPKIEGPKKITEKIMENSNLTITCKIIKGVPPPRLSWVMKAFGSDKIVNLPGSNNELIIQNATFANAAEYTCVATNAVNYKNTKQSTSKTIEVLVQKVPVAVIEEGPELTFSYGDRFGLSCKVDGFPLPKVEWKDSRGIRVSSNNTIVNWHQKISRVDFNYIKVTNNYSCHSENSVGEAARSVRIDVLSPFVVHEYPKKTLEVQYGQQAQIVCNITSSFSMRIKWFHQKINASKMTEISRENAFSVSSDATILRIISVDLELVGKYLCVATLVSDEEESKVFSTDVQIDNLAAPVLTTTTKLTVMENDWITISCTIVAGVPPPRLTWQFMARGETVFKDLRAVSEEFDMKNITVTDAGQYRCVAQNVLGRTEESTDVTVRKAPETDITEGSSVTVQYWSNNTFTCNVVAFPEPTLVWTDSAGHIVSSKETILNDHERTSQITVPKINTKKFFTCTAKNGLGESTSKISVNVLPPFTVHHYPEDPTNVHYAASTNVICNISSLFPMKIRWFHNSSEIHSTSQHTISADGTVLTIGRMDLDLIGRYKCIASLVDDEDEKKEYSTDILIDNLEAPVISSNNSGSVAVKNFEDLSLLCTIVAGVPPPRLTWQFMARGETVFKYLRAASEEFVIKNITFTDAGQYRCIAQNDLGRTEESTDVTVRQAPETDITEGSSVTVQYRSNITFTCNVVAFPEPTLVWTDSAGNIVSSKEATLNDHEKTSQITVPKIQTKNIFTCTAKNGLGESTSEISVNVLPPFTVHQYPEDPTNVHYAASTNVICNISSLFPMKIRWFQNSLEIHSSSQHTISADGTVLTIGRMDLDLIGKYKCIASLVDDEDEKKEYSTDVLIDNLEAPVIFSNNSGSVAVNNFEDLSLLCTIVAGVPPPRLTWQFKARDETVFKDLRAANEEIVIKNITFTDAGQYRCIAQNDLGRTEESTDVTVRQAPETDITEGSSVTVQYWSNNTFTCNVVAFPEPTLVWTDSAGHIVYSKESTLNDHEKTSQITVPNIQTKYIFTCTAKNGLGESTSEISVNVLPPFTVHQYPEDPTNVHYAASTNVICNISSLFPMKIRWFHNSSEIYASSQHTISADGTVLTIGRMDLDLIGKYKCIASLVDDEDEKKEYSTDVLIDNLKAPVITSYNGASVTVKNFEELSLFCTAEGNPAPVIKWQAMTSGYGSYQNVGEGNTLCTTNFGYEQGGQYICMASSVIGEDRKQISVVVV